jgi:hypothetical protein
MSQAPAIRVVRRETKQRTRLLLLVLVGVAALGVWQMGPGQDAASESGRTPIVYLR